MAVTNVADLLFEQAGHLPERTAFSFHSGGDGVDEELTYAGLARAALSIGGRLSRHAGVGDRVLLIFPPGLGFIRAFFGVLAMGGAAVPLAPPRRRRSASSVRGVIADCAPSAVLCAPSLELQLRDWFSDQPELLALPWLACGDGEELEDARNWCRPALASEDIALLQYTSGTTSMPKGVMVGHRNLLANLAAMQGVSGIGAASRCVFWLPFYHDMGLIGGVLETVFSGCFSTLLPPTLFVQHPMAWLETISRTRATISGGPDFAYRLCVQTLEPGAIRNLDLSSWELAFTGAEAIRDGTLGEFAAAFAPYGFRRTSFFPCYGLAEATLMVSSGPRPREPVVAHVDADALASHRATSVPADAPSARAVVGCGECLAGQEVRIVDPETLLTCQDGVVGEIWVRGPSVAQGYWGRPEESAAIFRAALADGAPGRFLRTGDLGFLRGGQLFVTGRRKDLIIVRGRNYYPGAIEDAIQGAHPCFRAGHGVAFSVDAPDGEGLVLVQEVEPRQRSLADDDVLTRVREIVAGEFDLEVQAVLLVKAGAIPKTTSGKLRRSACRELYLAGELQILVQWTAQAAEVATPARSVAGLAVTAAEIEAWLAERIAGRLRTPRARVPKTTPFLEFGIGSLAAAQIAADLGRWLGRPLSPTAVYNHPTIEALAAWLVATPAADDGTVSPDVAEAAETVDADQLLQEVQALSEEEMNAFIQEELARPQHGVRDSVPGA